MRGIDAAIAAASGDGALTIERSRSVVYTSNAGRRYVWNCRNRAEANETLAVFVELARRQIEKEVKDA